MKNLCFIAMIALGFNAHANKQKNVRVDPIDKTVTISIDGNFPKGTNTDVLFVVDNSASMISHQQSLASHIDFFAHAAEKSLNNFHIGVLSSFIDSYDPYKEHGSLLGKHKVITPSTPFLVENLKENLTLGVEGSFTEGFFKPVMTALSPEYLEGKNKGFYRPDADLAVVFLTDAYDQSDVSAWDFADYLVDLKGSISKITLQVFKVVNETKDCKADAGDISNNEIEEAVRLLEGDIYDLCSEDMEAQVATFSEKIFPVPKGPYEPSEIIDQVELVGTPIVSSIKVIFGNAEIPQDETAGWTYDSSGNMVIFSSDIQWPPQSGNPPIQVVYQIQ